MNIKNNLLFLCLSHWFGHGTIGVGYIRSSVADWQSSSRYLKLTKEIYQPAKYIILILWLNILSSEEAGRYLEAYKVYENKSAEVLMEKTDTDYSSKVGSIKISSL